MKLLDTTKVACHSIWNNKSRSILTTIIVAIVSALIMFIVSFGLLFNDNQLKLNRQLFDKSGYSISIQSKYYNQSTEYISKSELNQFSDLVNEYDDIIDSIYMRPSNNGLSLVLPNEINNDKIPLNYMVMDTSKFVVRNSGVITEGRLWNKGDVNKTHVWLSESYIASLAKKGIYLSIGDKINIELYEYDNNTNNYQTEFTLIGIFNEILDESFQYNGLDVIFDYRTFVNSFNAEIDSININYIPPTGVAYNFNLIYNRLKSFNNSLSNLFPEYDQDIYTRERVYCNFVQQMDASILLGYIIILVSIVLGLIVLLLSIGSVANTIIISVDKNRKFIGLLKALGLNQKGVKKLIKVEAFITIFLGLMVGALIIFSANGLLEIVVKEILDSMFSFYDLDINIVSRFNFLLPLITFIVFYLFAVLFSRGSLKKISSQDVIETISEVA